MKPKLIVYDTDRDITTKVVLKFAQGVSVDRNWEVRFVKINRFFKNRLDKTLRPGIDAVAGLGVLRGTGEMFRAAAAAGIDYYYLDHAYFDPGYSNPGWMRIVKNGHSINNFKLSSVERFDRYFANKNTILPWQKNEQRGDKIIVCPPTPAVSWYMGLKQNWQQSIVDRLKSILPDSDHSRIVVRAKPNEPVVDDRGNLIEFQKNYYDVPISEELNNAFCVIAYNSTVALTATLRGIPVIVGDHSCCRSVGFDIDDFQYSPTPKNFDVEPPHRTKLMHWLANNQWNLQEISSGQAWQMLQENFK
jgi:hypothetical protein